MWLLTLVFIVAPLQPAEIVEVRTPTLLSCIEAASAIYENVDGVAFSCTGPNGEYYDVDDYTQGKIKYGR